MSANLQPLAQGFVHQRDEHDAQPVAVAPRLARLANGTLLCSFVVQTALGVNDFVPLLCRSDDHCQTWSEPQPLWPTLRQRWSIFGSISGSPDGRDLYFYGTRTPIDTPGETFWQEANQGLKQNELCWARSQDGGVNWSDPRPILMPIPGSAEAPGALCVTRAGTWHVCYAPYPTFDESLQVQRNQVLCLSSADEGVTWTAGRMLAFDNPDDGGAEAWVVELADGRLLGAGWHVNTRTGEDYPNAFALSTDDGQTWQPTRSTDIMGQSVGLAAMPNDGALMVYSQRRARPAGLGLARVKPNDNDFGQRANALVWHAAEPPANAAHDQWTSFAFGEPAVLPLSDREALVVLWCVQPDGRGIRWVRVQIDH